MRERVNSRVTVERNFLDHALQQTLDKGLFEFPIFDADCHYLKTPLTEIADLVEEPWRHRFQSAAVNSFSAVPVDLGDRTNGGRTKVRSHFSRQHVPEGLPREIYPLLDSSMKMGIDYSIVFPTDLLNFGLHPSPEMETALAFGYARWMTERILPLDPSLQTMLYLPFSNAQACVEMVRQFADCKGVLGFLVTSVRYNPVYHDSYMPLYKLLEDKGKPLAFHTASHWQETAFRQFNSFLSAHALGFPFYNMIQLTNLVINGIPERFPDLKLIFIEAGIAWLPFIMRRLDTDYMYRSSEAPLLRKRPSEYIKDFYFTSQPLEYYENMDELRMVFEMFDAENKLLYASDYPHQDFDTPSSIYDLPFLSEQAKRKILGENALRLFNIDSPQLYAKQRWETQSASASTAATEE
ncbi:MAG: amidohydrolase [Alicyclobacillus sp.]|nr:amidohydrolase [Alicyclobacillus sp.]